MDNYKIIDKKELIEGFIQKYKSFLPEFYGDRDYYANLIRDNFRNNTKSELLDEVYYATGIFNNNENPYLGFVDFIEKKFGLDINILEVGGGIFPALSDAISSRQIKIKKGTITVYDPLLAVNKLKNIKLMKKEFDFTTHIKNYDLIIGIKPCNATYRLIEKATKENISFMVYPCNCTHHIEYDEADIVSVNEWHTYIYDLCRGNESINKKIEVDYLPKIYKYTNPIYSYKKEIY